VTPGRPATRLLLVHSLLTGCTAWARVAADLAADGYQVVTPDLTGTVTAGPCGGE
jgi:alpha-beta hydrolase superfamily lysophospholipase